MRFVTLSALTLSLLLAAPIAAQEQPAKSQIIAASLFKNGLAVIKREVAIPGPGTYRLDDVPEPVHGTWWVESQGAVETAVRMREVDVPALSRVDADLQEQLAGQKVVIQFRGGKLAPVKGIILKLERPRSEPATSRQPSRFLLLKTAHGRLLVDAAEIATIETPDAEDTVKQRKPVLVLTVEKAQPAAQAIFVSYLTNGLGWAPSYRVDISDPKKLNIELNTVIKNELADFQEAEVRLITGFPSVQFANVRSPLATTTTWAAFFQQLQAGPRRTHVLESQAVISNRQVVSEPGLDLSAQPMGEGVDLHFRAIGKRTLGKDEALSLTLTKGKADYERIVEWLIPDNRDSYGRYTGRGPDEEGDVAWDALRFKNPFDFPMTTAPAMVVANGQFNGQRTSYYVNAGEETMLRVTRALSIRTRNVEQEEVGKNGERDIVYVGGQRYRKSMVAAELTVSNHRKEAVKLVARRQFSGDLISAEGNPRTALREEGIYSVNKRNQLSWTFTLRSGEERKLTYRYSVLISF